MHATHHACAKVRHDVPVTSPPPSTRVGIGTDVHRLADGVPMHLAGLAWPDEPQGLAGHSDGDVAIHAAVDALLSAAGLGDIGSNFGTAAPEFAGASSLTFLVETATRVRAAGFEIGNVAINVIGNAPRIGHRRAEAEAVALGSYRRAGVTVRHHHGRFGTHGSRRRSSRHRYRVDHHPRNRSMSPWWLGVVIGAIVVAVTWVISRRAERRRGEMLGVETLTTDTIRQLCAAAAGAAGVWRIPTTRGGHRYRRGRRGRLAHQRGLEEPLRVASPRGHSALSTGLDRR